MWAFGFGFCLSWGSMEGSGFQDVSKEKKLASYYSNSLSSRIFTLAFDSPV